MARLWNRWTTDDRYQFLRRFYPDCWAVNSMSLMKWAQIPPRFRYNIMRLHNVSKEAVNRG